VDADAIRALLAAVPSSSMIATPPGHVAILCSRAERAGADLEAVNAWVIAVGGSVQATGHLDLPPSLNAAGGHGYSVPSARYYSIPRAALEMSDPATGASGRE
jgi:hypothetical protein